MAISIEQIDELRKRTNCSYEEAKTLLEKHNGNIIEAIVELEKKQKFNYAPNHENNFWSKLKSLFRKGFQTRFVILNKDETIINLSVNFMLLVLLFAFHILIVGLIVSLVFGYKFKIRKDKENYVDVDKIFSDVTNKVRNTMDNITEDKQEKKDKEKEFNEVTIE